MSEVRVARRYAKSLVELAQEKKLLDAVHDDMLLIRDTCIANRQLVLTLRSPIIHSSKKQGILEKIFGNKISAMTITFIDVLCRKNREELLVVIADEVHQLYNELNRVEVAHLSTPFALTEDLRAEFIDVVRKLSGKNRVELHESIDEELIGGYVLRIQDRQIDDSIRTRIQSMKNALISHDYEKTM